LKTRISFHSLILGTIVFTLLHPSLYSDAEDIPSQSANPVVLVHGNVSVKRRGWTNYAAIVFGTTLRLGDLLRVSDGSEAKIVCSDFTIRQIKPGQTAVPCPDSPGLLRASDGSWIRPTRSWPTEGTFPLVLSPRKTFLLSPNPSLRWTAVAGADYYRIQVRGPGLQWSTSVREVTEFVYPDSAPPLVPGVDYKLIVETSTSSSTVEPGNALGFSLLDKKKRQKVEAEEKRIRDLGLADGPTGFLIASLLASQELNAEAIEHLEEISKSFKVAAIKLLEADLYMKIGLLRRAESCYLDSLKLSAEEGDEIGAMRAHLALARIYLEALGNNESAEQQLNALVVSANRLGDEQTAELAGLLLTETKKKGFSPQR
jgi:hypothetical protein